LILDIGLPDGSGLVLLSELRKKQFTVPVMMLTALGATHDRVSGLNMGADDYMTKPFDIDELIARIRALHRRSQGISQSILKIGDTLLDTAAHAVYQSGQLVDLGPREFSILQLLFERADKVVTKSEIEEKLYGWGEEVSSNAIEVLVHRIRKKLGAHSVKTIRGVGYMTSVPIGAATSAASAHESDGGHDE
jgi:two-component system response regulator QseB